MSKVITISLTIPLSNEGWGGPCVTFYKWIPEDASDAIVVGEGSKEVSINIDKSCVSNLGEVTDELISSWANISVSKLNIEVTLKDVDDDLSRFIYDERESRKEVHHGLSPEDHRFDGLKERYKNLGIEVAELALNSFNRVVSYARNVKGQYWLTEHKFNQNRLNSLNNQFRAKVKIDNGEWFRWCPPSIDCMTVYSQGDEIAIKRDEWSSVSEYVIGKNRPNLIFELLANSRQLFDSGYMRSSIIEAVTAIEVSVSNFGKYANVEMLSEITQTGRIDIDSIGKQIHHLGTSGSIRYLIPLLFHEDVLPNSVLSKCYKALEVRNNVIHQGQRGVSSSLVREILREVTIFCRTLDTFTRK
ncbi:hypothetical protein [Mariprofundus sp. KV]|uniref:hypothetical protein n=1 Tax=Mariprofundus sp. KV TaxID=2608715 RepID=UPI0015A444DA|nr:hypothetical protein [Mariprofundus sp. KV]NWF37279.1 hypothetical protein [Mariprofundus sp. KV]